MDAVVDLDKVAFDIPVKLFQLLGLEPFKLFDQIKLKLHRNPGGKLKCDFLVGVGTAIASSLGKMPIAWVASTHFCGVITKLFRPT
jgi:hypothetical protein